MAVRPARVARDPPDRLPATRPGDRQAMMRCRVSRRRVVQVLEMVGVVAPPVDVHRIVEELGFEVIPFNFPKSIADVTFMEHEIKSIGVNATDPPTRQPFSVAHELSHYLQGHEAFYESKVHVEENRGLLNSHSRQEQEANEFAGELLMRLFLLRRDVTGSDLDVSELARRYQVSEQATWIQLFTA